MDTTLLNDGHETMVGAVGLWAEGACGQLEPTRNQCSRADKDRMETVPGWEASAR